MGDEMSEWIKTEHVNTDQYANVCREWMIEKKWNQDLSDHVIVHSGTDGISLRVQGTNNGYVHLDKDLAKQLARELLKSIKFSHLAKLDCSEIWAAKNNAYKMLNELRDKWKP
jgi:hypothetical protein